MPFRDRPEDKTALVWGASTLSISNTGGTDHLSLTLSVYQVFNSSRMRLNTRHVRITQIRMSSTESKRMT